MARQTGRETRQARRERSQRRQRRRRLVASSFMVVGMLAASAYLLDWLADADGGAAPKLPLVTQQPAGPSPTPSPTVAPSPTGTPTEPPPVLSLAGDFPEDGSGEFRFGADEGDVLGDSGRLLRYRVAVEAEVDEDLDEGLAEFEEFVDDTLGAPDGWTADGSRRFQRVPEGAPYDFTIYLATTGTTAQLCGQGGLDVVGGGLPEGGVSCRVSGQVVLNLHRWRLSVPHYVADEVPLPVYREMVLNHEVGHELGYGHEGCPEPGEPAPVMQQQTIFLDGCEANPWPFIDGEQHTGPPVG